MRHRVHRSRVALIDGSGAAAHARTVCGGGAFVEVPAFVHGCTSPQRCAVRRRTLVTLLHSPPEVGPRHSTLVDGGGPSITPIGAVDRGGPAVRWAFSRGVVPSQMPAQSVEAEPSSQTPAQSDLGQALAIWSKRSSANVQGRRRWSHRRRSCTRSHPYTTSLARRDVADDAATQRVLRSPKSHTPHASYAASPGTRPAVAV